MTTTLQQQANTNANDYRAAAKAYRQAYGAELIADPYRSAHHRLPITLTASVLIPAWNVRDTLVACLTALANSSFNCSYPDQLEVIVVDDGSTDGTWEVLQALRLNLRLKAIRQHHHSIAHTRNTGIAVAKGDIVVCCDADMVLAPFALEELIKRHQIVPNALLLGFRSDVTRDDPRVQPEKLPALLPRLLPPFAGDVRLSYGSMAENMCRDSEHLLALGHGRQFATSDGNRWSLPSMVYGALFSLPRSLYLTFEGYDERFVGWGCEDTLIGVQTLALGGSILPIYGAAGLHIAHNDRSQRKWQEFAANRHVFNALLAAPFTPQAGTRWLTRAKNRILDMIEHVPNGKIDNSPTFALDAIHTALADHHQYGQYLFTLGRFDEAVDAFAQVTGTADQLAWAHFDRGKALRYAGRHAEALEQLRKAAEQLPQSAWPQIELALAHAGHGQFEVGRAALDTARRCDFLNPMIQAICNQPVAHFSDRAAHYANQAMHRLALDDLAIVLLREPHNLEAHIQRARSLAALGDTDAAQHALLTLLDRMALPAQQRHLPRLELAQLQLATGKIGAAKVTLEQAKRSAPNDPQAAELLSALSMAAFRATPLAHGRAIATMAAALPGWYTIAELELLVALTLRAANRDGVWLLENGGYCGQAAITIGLTLRAMGHQCSRVLSYADPTLRLTPDGQSASVIFQQALASYDLAPLIVVNQEPHPGNQPYALVLIDGQHDTASIEADIARFGRQIAAGGLLLFHDYADYCPTVQQYVDQLLLTPTYRFVAQADTLIALLCTEAAHEPID
jgi:glycosyltransferase involved in cell wall biosynthesis/tetratricopeptide (TPR) repeat protein